jgi:hypothetical protein
LSHPSDNLCKADREKKHHIEIFFPGRPCRHRMLSAFFACKWTSPRARSCWFRRFHTAFLQLPEWSKIRKYWEDRDLGPNSRIGGFLSKYAPDHVGGLLVPRCGMGGWRSQVELGAEVAR